MTKRKPSTCPSAPISDRRTLTVFLRGRHRSALHLVLAPIVAVALCAMPATAQQLSTGTPEAVAPAVSADDGQHTLPRSPILLIDTERLFDESRFGRSLAQKVEAQANSLAKENRKLEAELAAEEQKLTDERPTTDPKKFREMAGAFDKKVTRIRRDREEKAKDLGQDSDAARRKFLVAVQPVLNDIMRETGAAVMLDRHSVFLGRESVDITDAAIARIDAKLAPKQDGDTTEDAQSGTATHQVTGNSDQFGILNPEATGHNTTAPPGTGAAPAGQGQTGADPLLQGDTTAPAKP